MAKKINYSSQFYGVDPFTNDISVIQNYHAGRIDFKKIGGRNNDGKEIIHLGVELEVDSFPSDENRQRAALQVFRLLNKPTKQLVKIERDGSLNNGFEIITNPVQYRSHLKRVDWQGVFDIVNAHGGTSHNSGNCGIHVHVEKRSQKYEENLWYLVNVIYRQELITFSRRTRFNYCQFDNTTEYSRRNIGHSVAFNTRTSNGNTLEFRFFRGTTKKETFLECLRLVERLCWLAIDHENTSDIRQEKLPKFTSLLSKYGKEFYQERLQRRG